MAEIQGLEITFEAPPQHTRTPPTDPGLREIHDYIEALVTWANSQFQRQAAISQNYEYAQLLELNEVPDRPTEGMVVLADGTNWDPGFGAGLYTYHQDTWVFLGGAPTKYEDLRFPAAGVNPPGIASDPDWDNTNGGYLFGPSVTEIIFLQAQLPHTWQEGTVITPHVHWQKTTSASGDVYWRLEYKWAPINEVMDAAFTTINVTDAVAGTPDTDTADKHLISTFGDISATGRQISDMLVMVLSRIGGDAADTYGADVRLLEFDIHHQIDSFGSRQEFIK